MEFLVLLACLNQKGCSETSSQYYQSHPNLQEFVSIQGRRIERVLTPVVIQYGAPVFAAALGQEGTIKLSSSFYLSFNKDSNSINFKREF